MCSLFRLLVCAILFAPAFASARTVMCMAYPKNATPIYILDGDYSPEVCHARAIACFGDASVTSVYSRVQITGGDHRTCEARSGPSATVSGSTTSGGAETVPTEQTPMQLGPERGDFTEARTYGSLDSGERTAYKHYKICTPGIPIGYRILAAPLSIRGDRNNCGEYAECRMTSDSPREVCWDLALQGHNEGGPLLFFNPDGGRRRTTPILNIRVMHTDCLPNWEVKVAVNGAKAPLNDAPCFTHDGRAGAAPNIDAWYRFKVKEQGTVRVVLSGLSAEFALQLRAANQDELARPAPRLSRKPQTIRYEAAPGEYLVRAQPISGPSAYQLSVFFTPASR